MSVENTEIKGKEGEDITESNLNASDKNRLSRT